MIAFIAKYMLYIYTTYIKEDFDIYKKWALPFIYSVWFIHGIYMWIGSIIFFPFFYLCMIFDNSNMKKMIEEYAHIFLLGHDF